MIEIRGATKVFLTRGAGPMLALDNVDLSINSNEFFTLLGPSGCGKTTLLRLLGGLEALTSGEIRIEGRNVASLPPQSRPVNTVFQSYALFPHMTVAQNVAFGLEMLGLPRSEIAARVEQALNMVRLAGFTDRATPLLSGGQQQRVALARALAPRPSLLLLDEPLSALDLKLRKEMQGELKRLQRETGITFVLVTHDQEEALAMSDRIAVMRDGRVLQIGTPQDIYNNPSCCFVADFIGETNLIPGPALGRAEDLTVTIRPERIDLSDHVNGAAGRGLGTIEAATFLGLDTLYEVALAAGPKVRARVRDARRPFRPGASVAVDWASEAERELRH
jgi:spermidine/putrescine transport system ATP-binding protein